jgi:hypothetical protein
MHAIAKGVEDQRHWDKWFLDFVDWTLRNGRQTRAQIIESATCHANSDLVGSDNQEILLCDVSRMMRRLGPEVDRAINNAEPPRSSLRPVLSHREGDDWRTDSSSDDMQGACGIIALKCIRV